MSPLEQAVNIWICVTSVMVIVTFCLHLWKTKP